jgi:hypothetical protein
LPVTRNQAEIEHGRLAQEKIRDHQRAGDRERAQEFAALDLLAQEISEPQLSANSRVHQIIKENMR